MDLADMHPLQRITPWQPATHSGKGRRGRGDVQGKKRQNSGRTQTMRRRRMHGHTRTVCSCVFSAVTVFVQSSVCCTNYSHYAVDNLEPLKISSSSGYCVRGYCGSDTACLR